MNRIKSAVWDCFNQHGITRDSDFHALSSSQVDVIVDMANAWRYRAPKHANGSRARYFFAYMCRAEWETLHVVQGNYGHGWEDLAASLNRREARDDIKAYRENAPGNYRLITRRVKAGD